MFTICAAVAASVFIYTVFPPDGSKVHKPPGPELMKLQIESLLFLSFPFAFTLRLTNHATEMIMMTPIRVPTKAPTMIPIPESGGYKQLVSKMEHSVCPVPCICDQWGIFRAFI